jgi:hypothetical protein
MNDYLPTIQEVLLYIEEELENGLRVLKQTLLECENVKIFYYSGKSVRLSDFINLPKKEMKISLYFKQIEELKINKERLQIRETNVKTLSGENPKVTVVDMENHLAKITYETLNGGGHFYTLLSDIVLSYCNLQHFSPISFEGEDWNLSFLDS